MLGLNTLLTSLTHLKIAAYFCAIGLTFISFQTSEAKTLGLETISNTKIRCKIGNYEGKLTEIKLPNKSEYYTFVILVIDGKYIVDRQNFWEGMLPGSCGPYNYFRNKQFVIKARSEVDETMLYNTSDSQYIIEVGDVLLPSGLIFGHDIPLPRTNADIPRLPGQLPGANITIRQLRPIGERLQEHKRRQRHSATSSPTSGYPARPSLPRPNFQQPMKPSQQIESKPASGRSAARIGTSGPRLNYNQKKAKNYYGVLIPPTDRPITIIRPATKPRNTTGTQQGKPKKLKTCSIPSAPRMQTNAGMGAGVMSNCVAYSRGSKFVIRHGTSSVKACYDLAKYCTCDKNVRADHSTYSKLVVAPYSYCDALVIPEYKFP